MEAELAQTREDNVWLVQEIDRLTTKAKRRRLAGIKDTVVAGLRETIATLKDEAVRMRQALEEAEERTVEKAEECREIQSRADRAAEQAASLSKELERACLEAELEKLHAVRKVTRKWEKREARLVRRVEELEGSHSLTVGKDKEDFGELRETVLFTAGKREDILRADDGVVEVGEGSCVTLLLENHGSEPLRLEEGTELGGVSPAGILEGGFYGREWESGFANAVLNTRCVHQLMTAEEPGDGRNETIVASTDVTERVADSS